MNTDDASIAMAVIMDARNRCRHDKMGLSPRLTAPRN
jgi:hypothetical protein